MFSKNILNLSLLIIIIVIIYTNFYNTITIPHSENEDDLKYIETDNNIIGINLNKQNLFEIKKNAQEDFFTSSNLINTDKYFKNNNNNIKIKKYNKNCKKSINDQDSYLYHNCLDDNYIINTKQVDILNNKYNINIYNKEKIINGENFLIGNNLIKGYEK